MPEIPRVEPEAAVELLATGHVFVDVRTEEEFEGGHVPGAYNVPFMVRGTRGLEPNPDFLEVMLGAFRPEAHLVVGCRSGGRSLRAAEALRDAGFGHVVDLRTGWEGCRDAFGRPEPGWGPRGLPVETGAPPGQRYDDLRARRTP